MITLNLQGGPAHGRIVRVDWASPTSPPLYYKVPLAPKLIAELTAENTEAFLTIKELIYRPVLDHKSQPMVDTHGYYYYEP